MLEAVLFIGLWILMQFTGVTNVWFLILFAIAIAVCLPLIRLVRISAPPFLPTSQARVGDMLRFAAIKRGERIYDLGCGDGRIVRAAAKMGGKATGFELSIPTYALAKVLTIGHKDARIAYADFWRKDYGDADVIFCFLLKGAMGRFKETVWPQLKPGTRVVSHMFRLPGVEPLKQTRNVYLYTK